jgi:hypothetical protein
VVALQNEISPTAVEHYERAKKISSRLEGTLKSGYSTFFKEAIPHAYQCRSDKPWKAELYTLFDDADGSRALFKFLKSAYSEASSIKTGLQQASVVSMLVDDGLQASDIEGIGFRYLLKLSFFPQISKETRLDLLADARVLGLEKFEALVESTAQGRPVETRERRQITGSRPALRKIEQFDRESTRAGDDRPIADKVAEILPESVPTPQLNLVDITDENRAALYRFWLEQVHRYQPELAGKSFWETMDAAVISNLEGYLCTDRFSAEEAARFAELRAALGA